MSLSSPSLGFLYSFGTSESLKCVKGITYFKLTNEQGREINSCYAAMVNTESFLVPYKVYIDRYVIAEVNNQTNDAGERYYELDEEWKEGLQAEGLLPNSLPPYQIGLDSYLPAAGLVLLFVGYIAWVIVQASNAKVKSEKAPSEGSPSQK